MGAHEALRGYLEYDTERNLELWRHNLVTRFDDALFLADEPFVTGGDLRMARIGQNALTQPLYGTLKQYVDAESGRSAEAPRPGEPILVAGRGYWHTFDARAQSFTTDLLGDSEIITGHYYGCELLPYIDSYYLEGDDELAHSDQPLTRSLGVHMMVGVPAVIDTQTDRVDFLDDVGVVYVPLHYKSFRFYTRHSVA